jgi:hypothetical protein
MTTQQHSRIMNDHFKVLLIHVRVHLTVVPRSTPRGVPHEALGPLLPEAVLLVAA